MHNAVRLIVNDQRVHNPDMTAIAAVEHILATVKLHRIHATDPITRAYVAVLRHPTQARYDAKEIDRHERYQRQHHH